MVKVLCLCSMPPSSHICFPYFGLKSLLLLDELESLGVCIVLSAVCLLLKRWTIESAVKSLKGFTNACLVVKIIIITHQHFRRKAHAGCFWPLEIHGLRAVAGLQVPGRVGAASPPARTLGFFLWSSACLAIRFRNGITRVISFICPHILCGCSNNGVSQTAVFGDSYKSISYVVHLLTGGELT